MTVKLILREKEYEVKPGMTLLDSLKKGQHPAGSGDRDARGRDDFGG